MEGQLGGLAEQALDALGVLLARHLDQDAVLALALDGRLAGADLVDSPADDLERLAHRGVLQLAHRALGQAQVDPAAFAFDDLDLVRDRIGIELAEQLDRLTGTRRIGQRQRRGVAPHAEAAIADPRRPQDRADVVQQRVEPLVDHRPQIDLEQQMRAALQVEAEIDLLVRQPVRQALHLLATEQVR